MPTVFSTIGFSTRISGTNDVTSNAAAWYLNDLNVLTTTQNTATDRTYYYEGNVASTSTFNSVIFYTSSTVQVSFETTSYTIVASDENTTNFIPYYLNDLNTLNTPRNVSRIRKFFINNYVTNLGSYVQVRITGSNFSREFDVYNPTNNSFTIALSDDFPVVSTGLQVTLGRLAYPVISPYVSTIALTSCTTRTMTFTKPVGFPEVGSALYAIIPNANPIISDVVGFTTTQISGVTGKAITKLVQGVQIPTLSQLAKPAIKILADSNRLTIDKVRTVTTIKEPYTAASRQLVRSTSTGIQYLSYPLKILGSDLARNVDLSWYIRDNNFYNLLKSTSSFVTYNIANPLDPFSFGSFTKARIFSPTYEKIVDIYTNTNNSFTVLRSDEISDISQLSVFLGNIVSTSSVSLTNSNTIPLINQFKSPSIEPRSNIANSLINRSAVKVVGDPVRFRTERIVLQNFVREPIVTPSRVTTYQNFTSTIYTDLIRVTGSTGVTSNLAPYYIFDNDRLQLTRSTSSFITLFFNNPNNNQSIGTISLVRMISPRFDITVNAQSYTTDSVTIADIFGFNNNIQSSFSINDLSIRLGIYFNDRTVSITNNNQNALLDKFKTNAISSFPNSLITPKLSSSIKLIDSGVRVRHTDFRQMTKVIGEPIVLRSWQTSTIILRTTSLPLREPIVLSSRTVTTSSFTATVFTDAIRITGSTGVTSNFANYYVLENNQITLTRSTSNFVTLYFNNPNNNQSLGNISLARLVGPSFDITVNVQTYTTDSITIADIFNFNNISGSNTINDLTVRLGFNYQDRSSSLSNANRVPILNPFKTVASFDSRLPALGNTKIRDRNFSTIEIPRVGQYRNITQLRDYRTYPSQNIVIPATTTTLFSGLIDIGGVVRTTSTFVSYYLNEANTLTTFSTLTTATTLLFSNTVESLGSPSFVKVFAYQNFGVTEQQVYEITLPIVSFNSQSVTVNWSVNNYKIRVQFGTVISVSGGTFTNYNIGALAIAQLTNQRYRSIEGAPSFTIGQGGKLNSVNQKLTAITTPLAPSRYNQSIVVKGEGRTFSARSTIVTTSSQIVLEPFPIYVWGKTETTSTAVKWYYNDEDILRTTNSTSSLITLYFDGLPIYQRTNAPFIKLVAPNAGYDYLYPVVTATNDSVTIQNIGIFPSVSNLYFYWARQGQSESYRYSDTGQITQINSQRFCQFQDPTTSKVYSSFTSTEQGWVEYNRRITNIAYVGSSTELTLDAPIIVPTQGQSAKIQYVDNNYYRTVPNNRRAVRFDGTSSTITFDIQQVFRSVETNRTPIMAEAWINVDVVEASVIMAESFFSFRSSILTLAIGGGPDIAGTKVWFGFKEQSGGWSYAISTTSLQPNTWYHVAGQFDGTEITLYINGKKDGASVIPPNGWNAYLTANSFGFRIGQKYNFFADAIYRAFFRGLIYQARVVQGQLVYTKNFVPPLNTSLTENSGATKFLACAFPIDQPLAQNYIGFPTPISYGVGGGLTFEIASIPPRYTFDAYPEEVYEINSATSTKIYLKGRIAYRPITDLSVIRDDTNDRPINTFDVYLLGTSQTYPVIRSTSSVSTSTINIGSLNQSVPKLGFGIEIPRVGKTLSIPKLRETLPFASKTVISINSSTQLTFNPTPLFVYGITASTSTFISYYINESNTLVTIPSGTALATLYLGNNPEYYRPLGTTVRITNSNSGYDVQYNIVAATIDSITIANPRDLPSVSGMLVYYGSVQTNYPSVNYSNTNMVGRLDKNTIGSLWFETRRETTGQVKQSLIVKGDRSDNQLYSTTNFVSQLTKRAIALRSSIEIPREFKFSTSPKIADPGRYQSPVYTTATSVDSIFYNYINLGRIASTTTFVTYYTYENNTITGIVSTGTLKTFNFSENVNPNIGLTSARIQGYTVEGASEIISFDLVLPIVSISTGSMTVNFIGQLPELTYRASLGKNFTTYRQIFSGTNNVNQINFYKTNVVENYKSAQSGVMNKAAIQLKDLQPNNNFQIGNYGQPKIRLAGDRTYISTLTVTTSSAQLIYLEPVNISGTNRSTSSFVSYFLSEEQVFTTFNSTSNNITLIFDRTVQVTADYTVARFTNFINYDFTATILTVNSQSVTILNPFVTLLPNSGLTVYLGKVWPGQTFRRTTNDAALQTAGINLLKVPNLPSSNRFHGIEIPATVAKLSSNTVLRYISNINRLTTTPLKIVTSLRAEKNADPQRTRSVTTSTSFVFESTVFRILATNLTTSSSVSWYLDEGEILRTYTTNTATLQLILGELPVYLQLQSKNTHVRLTNNLNYDQQFAILSFTNESINIAYQNDFPSISTLQLYFGRTRTIESVSFGDTSQIAKFNYKWTNWHTHLVQPVALMNKTLISLKDVENRSTTTSLSTITAVLQKPVVSIKGLIEIPRVGKTQSLINFREPIVLPSKQVSYQTTSTTIFYGPYLATGKIYGTSSFITSYLYENDIVNTTFRTGSTATLIASDAILPVGQSFDLIRIEGYTTTLSNVGIEFYTKVFEYTQPLISFTATSVSFAWTGVLPDYRWNFYLGRNLNITRAVTSNTNQISLIDRMKYVPSSAAIEIPRPSLLERKAIVVKDFTYNIRVGQARALTKIAGDRSYSVTTSTISYSTQTIYQDPVVISGINRGNTNFVQTYINDTDIITGIINSNTVITLYFAQPIVYTGQANIVKIARYTNGFYQGNRFIITGIEFENTYPIVSYTTSSVTINLGNNSSYIDLSLRSLAAYLGQSYQQPSSIANTNTSTLSLAQLAAFRPTVGIVSFAATTATGKLTSISQVKGIPVPLRIDVFKPKSSATLKGFFATTATAAPGKVISIPTVRDGYYPNTNIRTRTVTTNTTIVYESQAYLIYGTNLTTSTFVNNYVFETDLITTSTKTASTITLFVGSLPVIDPGLGLYVRLTNFTTFNTVTQVLSQGIGSVVITEPVDMPSISGLTLFYGALRNVESVNYTDTNYSNLNLFNSITAGVAFRKEQIQYPTFTPISVVTTGTNTLFAVNFTTYLVGQQAFTTPGTYTWIAPPGVTSVNVVTVGGGGRGGFGGQSATYKASGGGGGGLGYRNNISVVPGQAYTVVVGAGGSTSIAVAADTSSLGANGGDSFFINGSVVLGRGGTGGGSSTVSPVGGGFIGDGGGSGGTGGSGGQNAQAGGGGGAGGYSGNGGDAGGFAYSSPGSATATAGTGGGGGGGDAGNGRANQSPGYAGGGVGLLGLGTNGAAGSSGVGGGGSGGANGVLATDIGGAYGGGGPANNGSGGSGAVRIMWGPSRSYPSTLTTDANTINTLPKVGDYVKVTDLLGNSVLVQMAEISSSGIALPTNALTGLSGSAATWSLILWDPSYIPQTQVRTSAPPTTPREMLFYSSLAPIKFGRSLTLYSNQAVSPVNIIPAKTRSATTNVNTIVYDPQAFKIYGTNDQRQLNLSWYTTETNFISYETQPFLLDLYLGGSGAAYGLGFFNQYAYVRLINSQGYDQWFAIVSKTSETITIFNPYNLPAISTLSLFFGRIRPTDFLFWNDQGIVPTFSSTLTSYTATSRIILTEAGLITLPSTFRSVNKVVESTIYSTATSLVNRTSAPMAIFTDAYSGITYNRYAAGLYAAPIALSSATSIVGTSTVLGFLTQDIGQQAYTTAGTYSWTTPANVFYVSVVALGAGGAGGVGRAFGDRQRGGGGGGGLGWKNMIPVVPGQSYTVQVGAAGTGTSSQTGAGPFGNGNPGEASFFINTATVAGFGGTGATNVNFAGVAGVGGGYIGDGGGFGGNGGVDVTTISEGRGGGGGGAGGYLGNGGRGGDGTNSATPATQPTSGTGGGGAGGSSVYGTFNDNGNAQASSGAGGGVGIFGLGANGIATPNQIWVGNPGSSIVLGGGGGSGGAQGGSGQTAFATGTAMPGATGGAYGGGGGGTGAGGTGSPTYTGGAGGSGAVRIIWGTGRGFPSQFTTDQTSIDLTTQIKVGDAVRIIDSVGTIGTAEITAVTTTTMSVNTIDLSRFVGNPSSWTVTLWDRTVFQQSNVIITSARSTGVPRVNLALGNIAPGIRYNKTITQGITFASDASRLQTGPVKSANILRSPTNISANTVTNYIFKIDSENTQTVFAGAVSDSAKSILFYTTLAPGLRGKTLPLNVAGFRDTLPIIPSFALFNYTAGKALVSVPSPLSGNLSKQITFIRQVPTQLDRVGGFRIVPSMRGDTLRATVAIVEKPKLAPTGWNTVEVTGRGVIDKRFTVIKGGDYRNFTADKLSSALKVVPDSNRFYGDQRIRIVQYLQTPASRVRADLIEKAKITSTMMFETPRPAQISKQASVLKTVESTIQIIPELNFVNKLLAPRHFIPVSNVNKANLLDLVQVVFREQRGRFDVTNRLTTIPITTTVSSLIKPVMKLAFDDKSYFNRVDRLGNLQKGQFKAFFLDANLGWMSQPAEFPDLRTVQFDTSFGKLPSIVSTLRPGYNLDTSLLGSLKRLDKVGLVQTNFDTVSKVKTMATRLNQPVDIQLTANVRGLITKFTASRSGNLHDPSTRRAPPIQFWN